MDGDGWVTPLDAMFVINRIGLEPIGDDARADVNFDTIIDETDVTIVLNHLGLSA